ncbi:hypothetical protein P4132_21030 [Pseudomonas aeruginosa]|nr:hypothetical protein [Pseudomonas aeruginosa]
MEGRVRYGSYDDSEVAFGFNQALGIGPEPKHFVRLDVAAAAATATSTAIRANRGTSLPCSAT